MQRMLGPRHDSGRVTGNPHLIGLGKGGRQTASLLLAAADAKAWLACV